jgi:hypothetical protein
VSRRNCCITPGRELEVRLHKMSENEIEARTSSPPAEETVGIWGKIKNFFWI